MVGKGKVLVTGATGLLGRHLVEKLLERGYAVRALRRKHSPVERLGALARQIEWVEGDVRDVASIRTALQGVEGVFHCAARVSFRPADKELMLETNVLGTRHMVNEALEYGKLKFFVHVSSVAALGRTLNGIPIDETQEWDPAHYTSHYAYSKWLSEREVWRGIAEGLPAVIVNPSVILGRGNWRTDSSQLVRLIDKGLPAYPLGGTGYVDAYDVARAMIELAEWGIVGERFILSAENWLHRDLFRFIAMELGRPAPWIPLIFPLRVLTWLSEFHRPLIGKKRRLDWKVLKQASQRLYYNNAKIRRWLNFQFTPVRETLQRIVRQYEQDAMQKV